MYTMNLCITKFLAKLWYSLYMLQYSINMRLLIESVKFKLNFTLMILKFTLLTIHDIFFTGKVHVTKLAHIYLMSITISIRNDHDYAIWKYFTFQTLINRRFVFVLRWRKELWKNRWSKWDIRKSIKLYYAYHTYYTLVQ